MSKIIGTNPNQVPTNGDLGTMAYMDYDAVAPAFIGGRRNMLINGEFRIAQRGATNTVTSSSVYVSDRWRLNQNVGNSCEVTATRIDGPYLGQTAIQVNVDVAATALGSSSYCSMNQYVEGRDFTPYTRFGTMGAKELTLSFIHAHSIPGTYCIIVRNTTSNLNLLLEYEQKSANSWEKTELRIPGATTGTWASDNTRGINIEFTMTNGSAYQRDLTDEWFGGTYYHSTSKQTQMVMQAGAKFRISQVQLEIGTVATPFEYRFYNEELNLCKRYYQTFIASSRYKACVFRGTNGYAANSNTYELPVPMRDSPTSVAIEDQTTAYWSSLNSASYTTDTNDWRIGSDGTHWTINLANATTISNNELTIRANYTDDVIAYLDAEV